MMFAFDSKEDPEDDYDKLVRELKGLPIIPPPATPLMCGIAIVLWPVAFIAVATVLAKLLGQ